MARPKLDDSLLKHPRRIRKSPLRSSATTIPKPSKAEKKKWQVLANACIAAVLANDRTDNLGIKTKVTIFFAKKAKKPVGWPIGRIVERNGNGVAIAYNAELLLVFLYEHGLTPYTPTMLYECKRGLLNEYEAILDSTFDIAI